MKRRSREAWAVPISLRWDVECRCCGRADAEQSVAATYSESADRGVSLCEILVMVSCGGCGHRSTISVRQEDPLEPSRAAVA